MFMVVAHIILGLFGLNWFSCTPDQDFRCFYPCEIILSHISMHTRSSDPYVTLVWKKLSHIATHVR